MCVDTIKTVAQRLRLLSLNMYIQVYACSHWTSSVFRSGCGFSQAQSRSAHACTLPFNCQLVHTMYYTHMYLYMYMYSGVSFHLAAYSILLYWVHAVHLLLFSCSCTFIVLENVLMYWSALMEVEVVISCLLIQVILTLHQTLLYLSRGVMAYESLKYVRNR